MMINPRSKGRLFVISGPSGVGKGTVAKEILRRNPQFVWSVSCTTRHPRAGEIHGKDYFFLEHKDFNDKVDNGEFLEWAEVHGNRYGTLRSHLEEKLNAGASVILEIDVQGARAIKQSGFPGVTIFLLPPSPEVLISRLKGRGTEDPVQLKRRLETATRELEQTDIYDYSIVNDTLDETVRAIEKIILDTVQGGRT